VTVVPSLSDAISIVNSSPCRKRPEGILIDPHASVEQAHEALVRIEAALTQKTELDDPAPGIYRDLAELRTKLVVPTYLQ